MAAQRARRAGRSIDPAELGELSRRLRPAVARSTALARFDELFRSGQPPTSSPSGFRPGRLLTTSIWGPADRGALRLADAWMPWKGKSFDPDAATGVNRFDRSVLRPSRVLWPGYRPESVAGERVEMFPFRTRLAPGAIDPEVTVLKIDYDFEANPGFMIRRILDEVVEVAPGVLLGKILFRARGRFHPIGFFSLSEP